MSTLKQAIAVTMTIAAGAAVAHELFPGTYAPLAARFDLPISEDRLRAEPDAYMKYQEEKMRARYRRTRVQRSTLLRAHRELGQTLVDLKACSGSIESWLAEARAAYAGNPEETSYALAGKRYSSNNLTLQVASLLQEKESASVSLDRTAKARGQLADVIARLNGAMIAYESRLAVLRSQQAIFDANEIAGALLSDPVPKFDSLLEAADEVADLVIRTSRELDAGSSVDPKNGGSPAYDKAIEYLRG
ncbi:MAG: hypothetical protein U9R74_18875 [Pseudomonadota bacterium]|nr:hypothetical protein [Pseudomonadota bacterium]